MIVVEAPETAQSNSNTAIVSKRVSRPDRLVLQASEAGTDFQQLGWQICAITTLGGTHVERLRLMFFPFELLTFRGVKGISRVNPMLALPLLPYFAIRRSFRFLFGQDKVNRVFQKAGIASTSDFLAKFGVPLEIRPWMDVRTRFGYEPNLVSLLTKVRGKVFLDIGSHMGYYAWLLSKNFDEIIAFEPNPTNYEMLTSTVRFGLLKNVKPVKMAVSDHAGSATLYYSPRSGNQSLLGTESQTGFPVRTTTLDSLAAKIIDLVKIDVEGAEWRVIMGGETVLNEGKIRRLLIEVHDPRERAKFERFFLEKRYLTTWPDSMHLFAEIDRRTVA